MKVYINKRPHDVFIRNKNGSPLHLRSGQTVTGNDFYMRYVNSGILSIYEPQKIETPAQTVAEAPLSVSPVAPPVEEVPNTASNTIESYNDEGSQEKAQEDISENGSQESDITESGIETSEDGDNGTSVESFSSIEDISEFTEDSLRNLSRTQLSNLAEKLGIDNRGNKRNLMDRIVKFKKNN